VARTTLNLNVDAGESLGNYSFGFDEELIELVPTVNIACGAHAGDPGVMRRTVALAAAAGAEIGAHVGLPDIVGFGRRWIEMSPEEIADLVSFQVGALSAFTRAAGVPLQHVKPHGVLYLYCGRVPELRRALLAAVAAFDPGLRVIVGGDPLDQGAAADGLAVTNEGYLDLDLAADGYPVVRRRNSRIDPELAIARVLGIVERGAVASEAAGGDVELPVPTVCVHGDTPNAPELVRAVRARLDAAGVELVGLGEAMAEGTGASARSR
jgi:UPF0271 protein